MEEPASPPSWSPPPMGGSDTSDETR
jgi:hypothetical protein